ncbi:MAG TPA: DEAD/DEAH box helicase family protein [Gemmatimonadaceae bacterium]|nr:DEAD/DEAH box helicase family protein [Gemmatimonadaceae bacterium]
MSLRDATAIAARLSLRAPQHQSLNLLSRVTERLPPRKHHDLAQALATVREICPGVEAFERDFPSLCFALATGVGKTRLMGAFIAYLRRAHGVRHFFVLAPNLTIYDKLIRDFTPNTAKFVFPGLDEIASKLELITGDNWNSGRAVRTGYLFGDDSIHVNVFNVAKINAEVRGGRSPRIKRLHEYIGTSYFEYLAGLDDLVLIMDESHRYRADAGVAVLNELRPVLGLELTATPQVMRGGRPIRFRNVAYDYPLANAIRDGFVKEPAVATRADFNADGLAPEQLERLKLEDGLVLHENTKVELDTYGRQTRDRHVKPFVLVIARDTAHADQLKTLMEAPSFHGGRYARRVAIVHSQQTGAIQDEMLQRLLAVEDPDESTEIVIHVNMLGEGWDVTNLYTIVPLRAASSQTLVEQSIGRGLRLPYGRKTGVAAVDRLTIVAHDRFQEIVDYANRPDSVIRAVHQIVIGRDVSDAPMQVVTVPSYLETAVAPPVAPIALVAPAPLTATPAAQQATPAFRSDDERTIARAMLDVAQQFTYLPNPQDLKRPEHRDKFIREVLARADAGQASLSLGDGAPRVQDVFEKVVDLIDGRTIGIPRIILQPRTEVLVGFREFDLDCSGVRLQPVPQEILIQHLESQHRHRLDAGAAAPEARLEDYVVRELIDAPDVAYDRHADQLYRLAGRLVAHLRTYVPDDDAVANVLQYHRRQLADFVLVQLRVHRFEETGGYDVTVADGYHLPRAVTAAARVDEPVRDVRAPVDDLSRIRQMRFGGFARCLFPEQRFQSDPERRFAILLEDHPDPSLKWYKPASHDLRIWLQRGGSYEPDFVIETDRMKYLAEPKARNEMDIPSVQEKARSAALWCKHATDFESANGGKAWTYLLIPHDEIVSSASFGALVSRFTVTVGGPL